MSTIPSITATCPVCDAVLELKTFDPDIEEPIECPECANELDWEYDEDTKELKLLLPDDDDEDEELEIDEIDDEEEDEDEED
jgi:hypothetical protein